MSYGGRRPPTLRAGCMTGWRAATATASCSRTSTRSSWAMTSLSNVSGRRQDGGQ